MKEMKGMTFDEKVSMIDSKVSIIRDITNLGWSRQNMKTIQKIKELLEYGIFFGEEKKGD
jgi:hypothetical protein